MKEIADGFGDDEVMCIIKDKKGEMKYKCLLYHILMNMLKEEFEDEMQDKEYSDSEEEEESETESETEEETNRHFEETQTAEAQN
jgi:hypothetical protein